MFRLTKTGHKTGSGSPNYLNGAYDVTIQTISAVKYALVTSFRDNCLSIFNVNDPISPSFVARVSSLNGAAKVKTFEDGGNVYAVVTSYLDNEINVIDVTTPASSSIVGTLSGTGSPNFLDGAYGLYLAEISSNWYAFVTSINDNMLVIVDISTPASPSLIEVIGGSGTPNYCDGCHDVYVAEISSNWYAFVVSQDDNSLSVFDVETPASPSLSGSIQTLNGAHSICGQGDYVYISACDDGDLKVVDVSTPASPSVVGTKSDIGRPMGVYYKELSSMKFIFTADYLNDGVKVINVDTPASPAKAGSISGTGIPNYLDGIHSIVADDSYAYAVSYTDNALAIFQMDPNYSAFAATIAIETDCTCELTLSGTKQLSAVIAIETDCTCELSGGAEWDIGKPYWQPVRRAYIQHINGNWIDITHKVAEFGNINWQIEEEYHFNVFTANNMGITLKNEEEEFDVDKADNYFVSIGLPQSGYRVPIQISCGYLIDGVESLINVFHGLIIDIDTSTDDDKASIDLQCISRKLRDAKCDDIGDQWAETRLYGGDAVMTLRWEVGETDGTFQVDSIKDADGYKGDFPPSGYFLIDQEIVYFGYNNGSTLLYCVRGCKGTQATQHNKVHSDGTLKKLYYLMDSDTEANKTKYQFPSYPILKDSVTVSSCDGDITILKDQEYVLGVPYENRNLYGYVDYENGILELGAEPTNLNSVYASFKTVPKMVTYQGLIKRLLESENLDTDDIDYAQLSEPEGNSVPINYGRITTATQNDIVASLGQLPTHALAVNDDYVYLGIGPYLVRWDEEKFVVCGSFNPNYSIIRIGIDANGNVYGIVRPNIDNAYGYVFKYDGASISYLTGQIACYLNWQDSNNEYNEGAQWKGFSIDDTRQCLWFLCKDGVPMGIAKVGFDGTGYTLYSRPVYKVKGMDFCDSDNYIEFFYERQVGGLEYVQYDMLGKDSAIWYDRGYISDIGGDHEATREYIPCDMIYNPVDDQIYFNIIRKSTLDGWRGWFAHVQRMFNTKTILDTYTRTSYKGKYCGGTYSGGYAYYIRGTEKALGVDYEDGDLIDDGSGILYRVSGGAMESLGAMAYRPQRKAKSFIREVMTGTSCRMAIRSDNAIYLVASDGIASNDADWGFSLVRYAPTWTPVIRCANIQDRNKWDILSECAILSGYELGVSRDGKIFFRQRTMDRAFLSSDINNSVTTIPSTSANMDAFDEDGGIIQIDSEIITYTGKTANTFTGCVRGAYDSTASSHNELSTIFLVDNVFVTMDTEKTIKRVNSKTPNWDEIYNYIIVPYGDFEAICNYTTIGESWEGCSEQVYGRRELRIDNSFLSEDDVVAAKALAWRYYDLFKDRHSKVEVETVFQPQINIGDAISIKQPSRTILNYAISRIKQIQMELDSFFIRCVAVIRPSMYRENIYGYPYY